MYFEIYSSYMYIDRMGLATPLPFTVFSLLTLFAVQILPPLGYSHLVCVQATYWVKLPAGFHLLFTHNHNDLLIINELILLVLARFELINLKYQPVSRE